MSKLAKVYTGDDNECDRLKEENSKLRELIMDMLYDEECGHNSDDTFLEHNSRALELGTGFEHYGKYSR